MLAGYPPYSNHDDPEAAMEMGFATAEADRSWRSPLHWKMEIDDDPAWLEACMAAVDSMPVANLDSTASNIASESSNNRPAERQPCRSSGGPPLNKHVDGASRRTSATIHHAPRGGNISFGGVQPGGCSTTATAPRPSATSTPTPTFRVAGLGGHLSHISNRSSSVGSRGGGFRRKGGVGISVSGRFFF